MIPTSMSPEEVTALVRYAAGQTVLEVGSWLGHSTVAMAMVADSVHAVDWHRGDPHAGHDRTVHGFFDNLLEAGVEDRVIAHVGRSAVVLPILSRGFATFGFHDAYHARDAVVTDALLMQPLVQGLIAFHDYGDPRFEVTEAVADLGWPIVEVVGTLCVTKP